MAKLKRYNSITGQWETIVGSTQGEGSVVQSDWNQNDSTADDYIKNKPTIPTTLSGLTDDSNHRTVTDTEKTRWDGKSVVSGTNDGTNWLTITINGVTYAIPSSGGGTSNHDFTISNLANNTTSFTFPASQRCYQRLTMTAGATLNFSISNKSDNYVRVYNSAASDITLAIGTVTFNGSAVTSKVIPDDTIKVGAGKYMEIGLICDSSECDITVSSKLKLL